MALLVLNVLECFTDLSVDLVAKLDVVGEEVLDCLSSLCKLAVSVAEPRSALLDDVVLNCKVDDFSYS